MVAKRDKLISRVQKILRLAQNNPSAAEGTAALERARALIIEHRLSEAELAEADGAGDRLHSMVIFRAAKPGEAVSWWRQSLGSVVAEAHRGRCLVRRGDDAHAEQLEVFGLRADLVLIFATYQSAAAVMERGASKAAKQGPRWWGPWPEGRPGSRSAAGEAVANDFRRGFLAGLAAAYAAQDARFRARSPAGALTVLGVPAVLSDWETAMGEEIQPATTPEGTQGAGDLDAYVDGLREAQASLARPKLATSGKKLPADPD